MRNLLEFIVRRPLVTVIVLVIILFGGIYAETHMPVDLFPSLDIPVVNIITHYPGAAPEDMELLVSKPIEDEMRTINGVMRVSSTSVQGISQVTVEFSWGTKVKDARQVVQARLARLRGVLPSDVIPTLESIGMTLSEICGYVAYGSDTVTLRNTVIHRISGRLMDVPGVSFVEVLGGDTRAFIVRVRPRVLAHMHLGIGDIDRLLRDNNIESVAGYLDRSSREYLIRSDARFKDIDDIRSLSIRLGDGSSVALGSIAEVRKGLVPRHYVVRGDRIPGVAFVVRKQPGASTIKVARGVDKAMLGLKGLFPKGTRIKKFYDQSEIVQQARDEIVRDLVIGAMLAILVLYFFLGSIIPTFIVALTIPVTLLATLAFMWVSGLGLNVITMSALALAIGMVVDDAIVVAENIYRHFLQGKEACKASVDGTLEIAGPDASGTLTTVAAFLPLILVSGIVAVFVKPFGLTISSALVISLLLSLSLVPVLFGRLKPGTITRDFMGARFIGYMDRLLRRVLGFCLGHRRVVIILAVLSLSMAGLVLLTGRIRLLPPIDEGALLIEYVMPPGTALTESNRIGDELDRIALSNPDVYCVYRRTGSPGVGPQVEGVNRGELLIKLKPRSARKEQAVEIMASLKKAYSRIPGVVFLYHQPTQEKIDESFSGLAALFGVTVYGPDLNELSYLARKVEAIMSRDKALSNIVNNTKIRRPEIVVRPDYKRLGSYGISSGDVLGMVECAFNGIEVTRIIKQNQDIAVMLALDWPRPFDVRELRKLPILTRAGQIVPLGNVADIGVTQTEPAITRLNGQREVTLVAEVEGSIPAAVSRLKDKFKSLRLPKGYSIDFTGQYKVLMKTAAEMGFVVVSALILIYLILILQFRSWLQPLVILVTIPFTMVGAGVALFITGQGLDISVGMGVITLAGIAVNNAIVLVDYANRMADSASTREEALFKAISVRLRPILLTSLTTIFALIPAAIGMGVGSRIFQPFARTVIGGLISGLFGTLVMVPLLGRGTVKKA